MGVEVVSVQRQLLNIQRKPPTGDIIMFVRLAANLLNEKMAFNEVLNRLQDEGVVQDIVAEHLGSRDVADDAVDMTVEDLTG